MKVGSECEPGAIKPGLKLASMLGSSVSFLSSSDLVGGGNCVRYDL